MNKTFQRGPVPIHLKSVVAFCKNLGKCQIYLAQSIVTSLLSLKGSGHMQGMSAMKMQRAPHQPLKCLGVYCSYSHSTARIMGSPVNIECICQGKLN